ncbi:hypothetical protein PVAP13_1KG499200 [Panicum virgatum]|uniref:Uncharacterized protein n=1 Tax=Panicum virgatum TaxID=38727 RepID=A0A8T0XIQ6_PANVG|nr:hypothetical protein PVAP13_1KG499200 [Panicum virgatum]
MSSKRRGQDNQSQSHGKRSRPAPAPKKHLYLIDPDTLLAASGDGSTCTDQDPEEHLPEPAAFRFVAPAPASGTKFVAIGSNIVIVSGETEAPTLVYDTEAAALAICPPLPVRLSGLDLAVASGDALYALTTLGAGLPLAFEALSWARCTRDAEEPGRPTHEWSWKSVATQPPPFGNEDDGDTVVISYAAHPDGRTISVCTRRGNTNGSTYSLDTTTRREWRCHGSWVLPFRGQGYFDRELDAWVSLHEEKGYICACQVASRSGTATAPPDSDKLEEKLFLTLTYVGDSRFCLVESVGVKTGYGCVGRVTTFGLKFNRKGKLQITSHCAANSYLVSKHVSSFYPVAFWM